MEHRRPPGYPFLLAWVDRVGPGTMHEDALQFHRGIIFLFVAAAVLWVQTFFGHLVAILFASIFAIGSNYFVWISSLMMSDLFLSLCFFGYIWTVWNLYINKSAFWRLLLLSSVLIFLGQALHSSFWTRACIFIGSVALTKLIQSRSISAKNIFPIAKKTSALILIGGIATFSSHALLSINTPTSNYVNLSNWDKSQKNFISYWITISQLASLPAPKQPTELNLKIEEGKAKVSQTLRYKFRSSSPGACLILMVPSGQFLYNQLDQDAGHFRRYNKIEILRKINAAGWEVRQCIYFNLLGIAGWLLAGWLSILQRRKNSLDGSGIKFLIQIFDKYLTSFSRWMDALTGHKAGLSLFCVAVKR